MIAGTLRQLSVPDGLFARALVMTDAPAAAAVMAEQELVDVGDIVTTPSTIVAEWQRPSFNVSNATIGVFDGTRLIAWAAVLSNDEGDAAVDPEYRGRGIGTALARWMQDRARVDGATVIGVPTPAGSPGSRLMAQLGYQVRWTSWVLTLPASRAITPGQLPTGYSVREAAPSDYGQVHALIADAFGEWSTHERASYADFAALIYQRPSFQPWHIRIAVAPDRAIAGVVCLTTDGEVCFVDTLAVAQAHRRRGLARALLSDAFGQGHEHGAMEFQLATDSHSGALSLYEKLGMVITSTWLNFAVTL
jgi:GNAT superfamily N-acetyltransferase